MKNYRVVFIACKKQEMCLINDSFQLWFKLRENVKERALKSDKTREWVRQPTHIYSSWNHIWSSKGLKGEPEATVFDVSHVYDCSNVELFYAYWGQMYYL